jgi:hypothetical protein
MIESWQMLFCKCCFNERKFGIIIVLWQVEFVGGENDVKNFN